MSQTGRFDGDAIVAILLKHPRTAETIVEKLWREFVSLKPDPAEIKKLAAQFRANYELRPLMRSILLSAQFRDPANRGGLIKSPVELIVGTVHLLGLPVPEKTQLVRMMQGLGQMPFDPPNVNGWAGGESWITTYTLLLRQQFLRVHRRGNDRGLDGRGDDVEPTEPAHRAPRAAADEDGRGHHADGASQRPSCAAAGACRRHAGDEAKLGPDARPASTPRPLRASLLPRAPIDTVDPARTPGATVAAAMLDTAYQLEVRTPWAASSC